MVTCVVRQSCSYVFKYVSVRTVVWSSQGLTCLSERVGSDTAQPMSTSTRLFLQQRAHTPTSRDVSGAICISPRDATTTDDNVYE